MRALVLVFVAVAAIACEDDAPPPASAARPVAPAAATQRERDDCRDACEQQVIVSQAGDAALRACRTRCDARDGVAVAPHEVPSKITRAAPVHAPPAVRPR